MVSNVARTWARHGDQRSLVDRWSEVGDRLVALGGTISGPMSEIELDQMEAEVKRRTPAPAAIQPVLSAAYRELGDLRRRYHEAWRAIAELQKRLRSTANSRTHQLLNDIPADAFATDEQIDSHIPDFDSIAGARAAINEFLPRVVAIEGRRAQLDAAVSRDHEVPEILLPKLVWALFERLTAFESAMHQRVSLETARASALQEQIDRLESKPKSKQRKKRK